MLRYMLLAGAAAVAIPCASLAQVQWSQPLPGENNASAVMDQPGVLNSPTDYDIPFNQAPTGVNAGAYATAQQEQASANAEAFVPDSSDDTTTAQAQPAATGISGNQPAGGYYFGNEGDQSLASADEGAASPQASNSAPPEGAYSGQPSTGYSGGGYYTNQPGGPNAYVGQGPGSSESTTAGQNLGGEGTYQEGRATYGAPPASQGYTGGGYYTGQQGSEAPPNSGYAPPADQGYDTGQQGSASQPIYGNAPADQGYRGYYSGEQSAETSQSNAAQVLNQGVPLAERPVVIVPARIASARRYVRRTTVASVYEIEAARIALRRSQSSRVRDYANQMIQQHQQGLAIISQAAFQAGVPQRPMLDRAHRAMLHRLERVPAASFDHVYMHQQLVAHMRTVSVQEGYQHHGDNPVLQQAAAQLNSVAQQHLALTFADSGMADRLAEQRSSELAQLDQSNGRGQTYRGYTVIGPTAGRRTNRSGPAYSPGADNGQYQDQSGQYQGGHYQSGPDNGGYVRGSYDSGAANGPDNSSVSPAAYQQGASGTAGTSPYGTGAGVPGTGAAPQGGSVTPGTSGYGTGAGVPGTSGYVPVSPGVTPGYGGPQYQGYTGQGGAQGGAMTTSPGVGSTTPGAPGYQGYTTPGAPGYTAPGYTSPSYTTPSTPGYAQPGVVGTPGASPTAPGSTTPRSGPGG